MFHSDQMGDLMLERLDAVTVVCQPATIQDIVYTLEETLAVTHVWAPYMQCLSEGWNTAKNGQVI